ncbi:hypothetical protein FQN57_005619 [Myotisia sp. PD_48]|nr:hypothetical protein FQN57_005619 [Myotisia sp. PD_48]
MLSQFIIAAGVGISAFWGALESRPECSQFTGPSCTCPANTTFQESTTWAVLGANARDVKAIAGSFQNTDWFGVSSENVKGKDNTLGCTRTLTGEMPVGVLTFVERLYGYQESADGSFTHFYDIENAPINYEGPAGSGSFHGDWDVLDVIADGPDRTKIVWSIYACFTPDGGFEHFHESAIKNISSILVSQGKSTGMIQAPYHAKTAAPYTERLDLLAQIS